MLTESLDRLSFSIVAITARALQETAGPELTFLGWRVLVVVGETDGGVLRLGTLAARLSLSAPSASKLVRRLARRGLVALDRDVADRRGLVISLTDEGRRVRAAVVARRRAALEEALAEPLPRSLERGLAALAERVHRAEEGWQPAEQSVQDPPGE